jgi:hypothetical protein
MAVPRTIDAIRTLLSFRFRRVSAPIVRRESTPEIVSAAANGIAVANERSMADTPERERGAQEEKPGEREAKRAASTRPDATRHKDGRDAAPEAEVVKGNRSPKSPWMGGG